MHRCIETNSRLFHALTRVVQRESNNNNHNYFTKGQHKEEEACCIADTFFGVHEAIANRNKETLEFIKKKKNRIDFISIVAAASEPNTNLRV